MLDRDITPPLAVLMSLLSWRLTLLRKVTFVRTLNNKYIKKPNSSLFIYFRFFVQSYNTSLLAIRWLLRGV